jgi:hypothetical protein
MLKIFKCIYELLCCKNKENNKKHIIKYDTFYKEYPEGNRFITNNQL